MATRENNIKKINAQLEQLTDEELEHVAGGTFFGTAADTRALNKLGYNISPRIAYDLFGKSNFDEAAQEVSKIFNGLGITVDQFWGGEENKYYKDGQEISRSDALQIAAEAKGVLPLPKINY